MILLEWLLLWSMLSPATMKITEIRNATEDEGDKESESRRKYDVYNQYPKFSQYGQLYHNTYAASAPDTHPHYLNAAKSFMSPYTQHRSPTSVYAGHHNMMHSVMGSNDPLHSYTTGTHSVQPYTGTIHQNAIQPYAQTIQQLHGTGQIISGHSIGHLTAGGQTMGHLTGHTTGALPFASHTIGHIPVTGHTVGHVPVGGHVTIGSMAHMPVVGHNMGQLPAMVTIPQMTSQNMPTSYSIPTSTGALGTVQLYGSGLSSYAGRYPLSYTQYPYNMVSPLVHYPAMKYMAMSLARAFGIPLRQLKKLGFQITPVDRYNHKLGTLAANGWYQG